MILIAHIAIALFGLLYAAYVFFFPSETKIRITYLFVVLTFASGSYLTIRKPAHLAQVCIEGLVYLGIMIAGIISAQNKLAKQINGKQ